MPTLRLASERQIYQALDAAIIEAHAQGRVQTLANRYAEGAALYQRQGETDAACFFWTQAYVFALDAGDLPLAGKMRETLEAHGRMG